jgi:hypothetical protein
MWVNQGSARIPAPAIRLAPGAFLRVNDRWLTNPLTEEQMRITRCPAGALGR